MLVLKNFLVATDFGEAAANALAYGREFARRYDARFHLVHVVDVWGRSADQHGPALRRGAAASGPG
jgi:nucleotide-binding universal stress UspA family protein